ncbi:MAG: GxxExxY protein [Candidatus Sumerlaeota bacterium]
MAPINTDDKSPLYKPESDLLIGCAMEVHNSIGYGFHEKPYENALVVELRRRNIACEQQRSFDIMYKGEKVGEYIPDLLVFSKIVVDAKTIDKITDLEIGRMLNYLKVTGYRLGYIINFKNAKLQWKRVVR